MKYFYFLMLAFVSSMMMTSCVDDDVERSINLSGSWEGNLNMFYGIEDRFGNYYEFDAYSSNIVFYPDYDYATHGYGKQLDWYDEGPYEKKYYRFSWEIYDGVIYLDYPYAPELNTEIYEYYMDRDYFSGYFKGSNHKFRLYKKTDFYWTNYDDSWSYKYWKREWYGYSAYDTRFVGVDQKTENTEFNIVKRGRRILDN